MSIHPSPHLIYCGSGTVSAKSEAEKASGYRTPCTVALEMADLISLFSSGEIFTCRLAMFSS